MNAIDKVLGVLPVGDMWASSVGKCEVGRVRGFIERLSTEYAVSSVLKEGVYSDTYHRF